MNRGQNIRSYARTNGLTSLAWFMVDYPAYSIKVQYKAPSTNSLDFQRRAILKLIHAGVPYSVITKLLAINDPHEAILSRLKSSEPALIAFSKEKNRLDVTPVGEIEIERETVMQERIKSRFIDGVNLEPFPAVITEFMDFVYDEVDSCRSHTFPHRPIIDNSDLDQLRIKLSDPEVKKSLNFPDKSTEFSLSCLDQLWIKNDFTIGIFLSSDGKVIRKLFVGENPEPIQPFGYLSNLSNYKLSPVRNFIGIKRLENCDSPNLLDPNSDIRIILDILTENLVNRYGIKDSEFISLTFDNDKSCFTISTKQTFPDEISKGEILNDIRSGYVGLLMFGGMGQIFVQIETTEEAKRIAELRHQINANDLDDWHDIIAKVIEKYPENWRKKLIETGRQDLLFQYDIENYINN